MNNMQRGLLISFGSSYDYCCLLSGETEAQSHDEQRPTDLRQVQSSIYRSIE